MSVMANGELFLLSQDGVGSTFAGHYDADGMLLSMTPLPLTGLYGIRCWTSL